jgi:hypothetical protein
MHGHRHRRRRKHGKAFGFNGLKPASKDSGSTSQSSADKPSTSSAPSQS